MDRGQSLKSTIALLSTGLFYRFVNQTFSAASSFYVANTDATIGACTCGPDISLLLCASLTVKVASQVNMRFLSAAIFLITGCRHTDTHTHAHIVISNFYNAVYTQYDIVWATVGQF